GPRPLQRPHQRRRPRSEALPPTVEALEDVLLGPDSDQRHEPLNARAALARYANTLALVLAVRKCRKLTVGQAQARVVAAHVELQRISELLTSWEDVVQ